MHAKKNSGLYTGLALLALSLSTWSAYIIYQKSALSSLNTAGKPDAFMEEVIATLVDKQGQPSLRLVSPKMTHYLESDSTDIIKPLLTLYRNNHQQSLKPWHLSANHAKALQGLEQILLWDQVVINHPGDSIDEKTLLLTPTLTVYPELQKAETTDPVTIKQPNSQIQALGMNADLASGAIKLLAQAQGEYRVEN